jgi:hypothetical protein
MGVSLLFVAIPAAYAYIVYVSDAPLLSIAYQASVFVGIWGFCQ